MKQLAVQYLFFRTIYLFGDFNISEINRIIGESGNIVDFGIQKEKPITITIGKHKDAYEIDNIISILQKTKILPEELGKKNITATGFFYTFI